MQKTTFWLAPLILLVVLSAMLAWWLDLGPGKLTTSKTDGSISYVYAQGLAEGRAYLPDTPDPRLVASPTPFSPENAPYHRGDFSYYRGRFYLYFGVVPFATLVVPWLLTTGTFLTDATAIWIFLTTGLLAYAAALGLIWRNFFPATRWWVMLLALALLAATNCSWLLTARPSIYELACAAAFGCFGVAVWSALASAVCAERTRLGLVLSAVFLGLTMGCRPNYAPAVTAVASWLLWQAANGGSRPFRSAAAVLLPLAVIGGLLAAFNYLRFDNPLEFGFRYQMVAVDRTSQGLLVWGGIPYYLHRYLVGLPSLGPYFPFIQGEVPGPLPLPRGGYETVLLYGCLVCSPGILAAGLSFLNSSVIRPVRLLVYALFAGALGNLLLLSAMGNGCYRYPVDFLAPLAFLAAVGVFQAAARPQALWRRLLLALIALLAGASAVSGLFQVASIAEIWSQFDTKRPIDYARLARPFNTLVYAGEQLFGPQSRAIRLTLQFPSGRPGTSEPLVARGSPGVIDIVYVYYPAPGLITLGLSDGPQSAEIPIDFTQPHTVEVRYGNDLPPNDHPQLAGLASKDLALARRTITLLLDNQIVLDGWVDFRRTNGQVYIGTSPDPAFGPRFTGRINKIERPRLPIPASPLRWQPEAYGSMAISVVPVPMPVGTCDPLVSCGDRSQGAQLLVEHLSPGLARLGWIETGGRKIWSSSVAWPDHKKRAIRIEAGILLPPESSSLWPTGSNPAEIAARKQTVRVWIDDQPVLEAPANAYTASPLSITPGIDTLYLHPGVVRRFLGPIEAVQRRPW